MTVDHEIRAIKQEAARIEEDALHSAKGHFNAEGRWQLVNLSMGIGTALVAGASGVSAFSEQPIISGLLAFAAAFIAGASTALNPESRSSDHEQSGRKYKTLSNRARIFREVQVINLEIEQARAAFATLGEQRDELNESSRAIPRWAYERAIKDIDQGRATYQIDKVDYDRERISK